MGRRHIACTCVCPPPCTACQCSTCSIEIGPCVAFVDVTGGFSLSNARTNCEEGLQLDNGAALDGFKLFTSPCTFHKTKDSEGRPSELRVTRTHAPTLTRSRWRTRRRRTSRACISPACTPCFPLHALRSRTIRWLCHSGHTRSQTGACRQARPHALHRVSYVAGAGRVLSRSCVVALSPRAARHILSPPLSLA